MNDLVKRLRSFVSEGIDGTFAVSDLAQEAADEIEKLTRQRDQARAYASSLAAHLIGCGDELP